MIDGQPRLYTKKNHINIEKLLTAKKSRFSEPPCDTPITIWVALKSPFITLWQESELTFDNKLCFNDSSFVRASKWTL